MKKSPKDKICITGREQSAAAGRQLTSYNTLEERTL